MSKPAIEPRVVDDHAPEALAIMVTRRCNMRCTHCSVESTPEVKDSAEARRLENLVREAARSGVKRIQLTGGEPMLHPELCLSLIRLACDLGMSVAMVSNGYWGRRPQLAAATMKKLKEAGLGLLTISYDRFHAESQSVDAVTHIADVAESLRWYINVNVTRCRDDRRLDEWVDRFDNYRFIRLRFYDVQAVGAARSFDRRDLRSRTDGFCSAACIPAITDDGRMTACNGPSYFSSDDSPLVIGRLEREPLAELLHRDAGDPILSTIRTSGPAGLRRALQEVGGVDGLNLDSEFPGLCSLCLAICSNAEATGRLREVLADERLVAERAAIFDLIGNEGRLDSHQVNGPAVARLLLTALDVMEGDLEPQIPRIFGRADLDWLRLSRQIERAGLATPLLALFERPDLVQLAPRFFSQDLDSMATMQGLREAHQRAVLSELDEALRDAGQRAVLLKGIALQSLEGPSETRATGDIDLLLPQTPDALALHEALQARGFELRGGGKRTGPHHLAGLYRHGILVELHDRMMPAFWGLPEREMLATVRPAERFGAQFDRLGSSAMFLHAAIHSSAHLYTDGLKLSWDLAVLSAAEDFDWRRVTRWADAMRMPLAFYVPSEIVRSQLDMRWPCAEQALATGMGRRLATIARHRLFHALDGPFEINPWAKTAVFLMMQRGLAGRLRYVGQWLLSPTMREARHSAKGSSPLSRPSLAEAFDSWRRYRQALRPQ